jgi:hypothetical protein
MLDFVARGVDRTREYDVAKDPCTGEADYNPPRVLAIEVSSSAPSGEVPRTKFRGEYYTVPDTAWDLMAFRLLYQCFQMTVTDVSQVSVPITISK